MDKSYMFNNCLNQSLIFLPIVPGMFMMSDTEKFFLPNKLVMLQKRMCFTSINCINNETNAKTLSGKSIQFQP